MREEVANRTFTRDDQVFFAGLSGDRNPMHMDPIAARRTQAGAPVVHGIHTLAWFLDSIAHRDPDLRLIGVLKVRFDKLVYLGDQVCAVLTHRDDKTLRGEILADGVVVARIAMQFGPLAATPPRSRSAPVRADAPLELDFADAAERSGTLVPAVATRELAAAFPSAARAMSETRLSALVCTTYLVGMVCPGLHSIFAGLTLAACEPAEADDANLEFNVTSTDPRFRMIKAGVAGGGWIGTVESFMRHPPVPQASMAELRQFVRPGEFAGRRALVIGGSRGLGELAAKLIAAGGGATIVTYAAGAADAARVADEIVEGGGACAAIHYDIGASAAEQLANIENAPTSFYYMATPPIFRRKSGLFDPRRFDDFFSFYVTGFWNACEALRTRRPNLSVFYPSSVAVEERPADMTEYAMAKMAGEILCADAANFLKPMRIATLRLPRLPTDQTATLQHVETADPLALMLPLVREVERTV